MPTRYQGKPAEVRALNAFIKLSRAVETVNGRLNQNFSEYGLTGGQFAVLEALHHLGSMCQGDLGKKLLRSNPNMTTVLDNLEKSGLVKRERSVEDRRQVMVSLTREGRRLIERIFPSHAKRIAELMSPLSDSEQEELGRLCRKLGLGQKD